MKIYKKVVSTFCAAAMIMGNPIGSVLHTYDAEAANPYLPLWEHVPDGEPHVFEDPDNPGEYRVYIYGSHDIYKNAYAGDNQVVWSASVDDLTNWRYDGVCFTADVNEDGENDTLYAPDICEVEEDGQKVYYYYPNDMANMSVVAKGYLPTGPFEVYDTGYIGYGDPAVFVDDDGAVYTYYGADMAGATSTSQRGVRLDPDSMTPAYQNSEPIIQLGDGSTWCSDDNEDNEFRFYEASSYAR